MNYKVVEGDCLASLRVLPPACINTYVTSPPYFGLRDYGVEGQIGLDVAGCREARAVWAGTGAEP